MSTPITAQSALVPASPLQAVRQPRNATNESDDTYTACSVVFDLGTTYSRACLVPVGALEPIPLPSTLRTPMQSDDTSYAKPMSILFGTHGPPRQSIVHDDDADHVPLQFFPEIQQIMELREVLGTNDYETAFRSRLPKLDSFFTRYDELSVASQHDVRCRVEDTYLKLLEHEHIAAKMAADKLGCKITKLLITFPSSWTPWVQKYHAVCLQMAWELPLGSIELMYECEAIVSLILFRSAALKMDKTALRSMLVVHLGAHLLSIDGFCLEPSNADSNKFHLFSNGNIGSAHSGAHLHAALVKARIRSYIHSHRASIPKSNEETMFKNFFASYLHRRGPMAKGQAFDICAGSNSRVHHQILFSDENSRQLYDRCFSDALDTIEKVLCKAAIEDEPVKTEVVLAGCGFSNSSIREEVEKRIRDRGFVLHDPTHSGFDTTEPKNVATGAACTIIQAITADEYIRMACFAVRDDNNNGNSHSIIWSHGSSRTARVAVAEPETAERFIVCYPAPRETDTTEADEPLGYTFSRLPSLPSGDYTLHMEYETSSASDGGVIFVHIHAADGGEFQIVKCPFYYDCASRLCFRDIDNDQKLDTEHRINMDLEGPERLRLQTHEEVKVKILARQDHRPPRR